MHFTVQVEDRIHLAKLMRNLRKVAEVVRLARVKGNLQDTPRH
jgi:GTP pyrophosphokinase